MDGGGAAQAADWREVWFGHDSSARLIVDENLRLIHVNSAAEELFVSACLLGWSPGAFLSLPGTDATRLRLQLRAVVAHPMLILAPPLVIRVQRLGTNVLALTLRDTRDVGSLQTADLDPSYGLTRAEQRTLFHALSGLSAGDIAARLNKSVETVRTHMKHLHGKLGVKTKEQLFARVLPYLFLD